MVYSLWYSVRSIRTLAIRTFFGFSFRYVCPETNSLWGVFLWEGGGGYASMFIFSVFLLLMFLFFLFGFVGGVFFFFAISRFDF